MEGLRRGEDQADQPERVDARTPTETDDELWWDDFLEADAETANEEADPDWNDLEGPEPVEDLELERQDEPERPYRGGRFRDLPTEPGRDRHHLIAAQSLKAAGLDSDEGLAVVMEQADHRQTKSWGRYKDAKKFRDEQTALVVGGQEQRALNLGVEDVVRKFPGKYDDAIREALDAGDA